MSVISEQMALRFDLDTEVQKSQTVGNKSHEPNVQLVCIIFFFCNLAYLLYLSLYKGSRPNFEYLEVVSNAFMNVFRELKSTRHCSDQESKACTHQRRNKLL